MKPSFNHGGPAYKHAHTAMAHAKMKGINDEICAAFMAVALAKEYDLNVVDAIKLAMSCSAYAQKLMLLRGEQNCVLAGEDVEQYRRTAAPGHADVDAVLADPPLLRFLPAAAV